MKTLLFLLLFATTAYAAEVRFYSNDGKYQGWATQNPTSPNEWNRYSNDGRYLGRIVTDKPRRDTKDERPQKESSPFFFEKNYDN